MTETMKTATVYRCNRHANRATMPRLCPMCQRIDVERDRAQPDERRKACPVCAGRLVMDDTTGRVYCETNSDHTPADDEVRS